MNDGKMSVAELHARPAIETINGKTVYHCGTLDYTRKTLIYLFVWMLWGDFCYTMMEMLIPTLLPVVLKQHDVSNTTIGLLVGSIPALINFILNPIISTSSDRTRSKWGRRIPYLLFSSPFVVMFLILVGWSDQLGAWLYNLAWGDGGSPAAVIVVMLAIFSVGFQVFNLFVASVFYYIFADVVPKPFVGRFMAFFRVVGTAAGIVFSKWVLPLADQREMVPWIFTGVALVYLVSFTQMCFMVKEGDYPPPEKIKKVSIIGMIKKYSVECFSIPFYLYLFIGMAINTTSNACRVMFNLLYAKEDLGLSMEQYGHIAATVSLVMLFAYIPLGWIVDKCHPLRVFIFGGILIICANVFGFFWCHDYTTFFIVTFMISGTYVLQGASSLPLTVRIYPSEKYGQFCSANAMIGSIVLIVANAGGGAFIDLGKKFGYGYNLIFVWDFFFTIIATALLLMVYFKWKKYGGDKNYVAPIKNISL
ncbi:MAG: SLC45 family MFS transporter [Lentisphaerae bacterium]|nr:SLC45 family MFS transporter [Lentisphaerota bacterium]